MNKLLKKLKKLFRKGDKSILVSALLSASFLTVAVFLLLYVYINHSGPFEYVHAETNKLGQSINIALGTRKPVKTRVEYGTSKLYLNTVDGDNEFKVEHNIVIPGVLPKKHYIRIVAYTESGKEYKTNFYTVE